MVVSFILSPIFIFGDKMTFASSLGVLTAGLKLFSLASMTPSRFKSLPKTTFLKARVGVIVSTLVAIFATDELVPFARVILEFTLNVAFGATVTLGMINSFCPGFIVFGTIGKISLGLFIFITLVPA